MSHLLANLGQKSGYVFELPRAAHPLSPPDTENEPAGHASTSTVSLPVNGVDSEPSATHLAATEIPAPFYRRPSGVTYINSGPREARDRTQKSLIKWLVVVIPPTAFTREHGHLGHTLSTGSVARLSQGILMPLFPTMSGQLGAIAREFSLPSTTGICLYLHTSHNGIALYPRISDETWHLLWAHLFEARSPTPPPQQLPIGGQIEFDVDLAKARWYDAWLSSPRKEYADVPHSAVHSRRPSLTHLRNDSRTTFLDQVDDQLDSLAAQPTNAPRLVPRKLNLVDRYETLSVISASRTARHLSPGPSPTNDAQFKMLSPIRQEEEPKSARKNLDTLVTSWRATASVAHSPLAATGQTSLDPANMPNTLGDLPSASNSSEHSELNLDDYAWSVSSAGPPEYECDDDDDSVVWRLPSPDIAMRALSDVPPTPATATSWGAPSYPPSPLITYSEYAASVDLAGRAMSSRPATPSTATSWGPPSYPVSPLPQEPVLRVPSPGLADRAPLSVPPTPATATSWGAPSYPASPAESEFRAPSPDLGARAMLSAPPSPLPVRLRAPPKSSEDRAQEIARLVWPYYSAQEQGEKVPGAVTPSPSALVFPYYSPTTQTWNHVWPYQQEAPQEEPVSSSSKLVFPYYKADAPSADASGIREAEVGSATSPPSKLAFPYYDGSDRQTHQRKHVGPYVNNEAPQEDPVSPSSKLVFPYYKADIQSADVLGVREDNEAEVGNVTSPSSKLVFPYYDGSDQQAHHWRHVWPYVNGASESTSATGYSARVNYPYFDLYPAVYPSFNLYPSVVHVAEVARYKEAVVIHSAVYPAFDLYPAVYPHFNIYPSIGQQRTVTRAMSTHSKTKGIRRESKGISVALPANYPAFNLYPAVYPHMDIYPAKAAAATTRVIYEEAYISSRLASAYPIVEPYPPVYPWNLQTIYPSVTASAATIVSSLEVRNKATAPAVRSLDGAQGRPVAAVHTPRGGLSTPAPVVLGVSVRYPDFDLYPSVKSAYSGKVCEGLNVELSPSYPNIVLYRAVYPWNLIRIYPAVEAPAKSGPAALDAQYSARASSSYSAVFGSAVGSTSDQRPQLSGSYPYIDIYPAVYPHNLTYIYPPLLSRSGSHPRVPQSSPKSRSEAGIRAVFVQAMPYPALEIYPPVYPHLSIYPKVWRVDIADSSPVVATEVVVQSPQQPPAVRRPRLTHLELHQQVFGAAPSSVEKQLPIKPSLAVPQTSLAPPSIRSRSGTVSVRPVLPPKPAEMATKGQLPPVPPTRTGTQATPAARRLSISANARRPLSGAGLPPHPAVNRRMSVSASSRPLSTLAPSVPSKDPAKVEQARKSPTRPTISLDSIGEDEGSENSPSTASPGSAKASSATLPAQQPLLDATPALSRSKTMPNTAREGRPSAVLQRAKVFDQSNSQATSPPPKDDSPTRTAGSALSRFPTPPKPTTPSSPTGRPVAKLDRSKYPFS